MLNQKIIIADHIRHPNFDLMSTSTSRPYPDIKLISVYLNLNSGGSGVPFISIVSYRLFSTKYKSEVHKSHSCYAKYNVI